MDHGPVDNLLPAAGLTNINSGMTTTNFIGARVGARFALPRIDAQVTARGTAVDGVEVRTYAAAQSVLRFLDAYLFARRRPDVAPSCGCER